MRSNVPMTNSLIRCLDATADQKAHPAVREQSHELDPVARLTISLPRSLYRQIRLHALEQDTTLSALLARLIRDELGCS